MAPTVYREKDTNLPLLRNTTVALLGYGNQGRAHALNLRDSGTRVTIGQRPGKSFDQAKADGFRPIPIPDAVPKGDLVIIALPDETAAEVYKREIAAGLRSGQALGFVHGFNIRFGLITPPDGVDVVMVAPKGPGSLVRSTYVEGKGLPALIAVHKDNTGNAKRIALAWAACLGATRAGAIETTFETETDTDLFGEQVVLCGGVEELMTAAFETLVDAGYEPAFAYLECVHELKQIVDIVYAEGLSAMCKRISNTAEYGGMTRGPRIVTDETRAEMKRILEEVRNGQFAKEWLAEHKEGTPKLRSTRDAGATSLLEQAGKAVRRLMHTE
ncbi:MAG: ketol-acid reductoisomerase [Phycisphaerales bacterium]|nr:MAG: ketol-acid reductoisomerase [Phycisphaerales bacterium]